MARKRRLLCEPQGDVTVVNFVEKKILDELNIKEIGDELMELVDQYNKDKILINFENVEYLSSECLSSLFEFFKQPPVNIPFAGFLGYQVPQMTDLSLPDSVDTTKALFNSIGVPG